MNVLFIAVCFGTRRPRVRSMGSVSLLLWLDGSTLAAQPASRGRLESCSDVNIQRLFKIHRAAMFPTHKQPFIHLEVFKRLCMLLYGRETFPALKNI